MCKSVDDSVMKRFILLLIIFITPATLFAQTTINWVSNVDFAKRQAISANKPRVLYFTENPQGTRSKVISGSVLVNGLLVKKVNNDFIPLLLEGYNLLEDKYGISRYPTLLVLDINDQEMDRLSGTFSSDQALAMLNAALLNHKDITLASATTGTSNSGEISINSEFSYSEGKGYFVKISDTNWEHRTAFYTITYTQTKEDNRHIYLVAENKFEGGKKIHVAVPKSTGITIWLWNEGESNWIPTEKITLIERKNSID